MIKAGKNKKTVHIVAEAPGVKTLSDVHILSDLTLPYG